MRTDRRCWPLAPNIALQLSGFRNLCPFAHHALLAPAGSPHALWAAPQIACCRFLHTQADHESAASAPRLRSLSPTWKRYTSFHTPLVPPSRAESDSKHLRIASRV